MRTSGQLDQQSKCENNKNTSLTTVSYSMVQARAQKNIIKRILDGEPIPDIEAELDNLMTEGKFPWENFEQRIDLLHLLSRRVQRYVEFESRRTHIFPTDDMNLVVDYFGEPVQALPDFFIDNGDSVTVCKVTTSRIKSLNDAKKDEAYVLGLCAEQNFPGKPVIIQYLHLAETNKEAEKASFAAHDSYETPTQRSANKIAQFSFDEKMKDYFEQQHRMEELEPTLCSPEVCATCPSNCLCHFEEAPIRVPAETGGVSLDNIRLKKEQRDVVEFERGVARVNAGAGAGKTLVTAARIVKLLEKGAQPEDFCLLTFTKAGAEEMTSRVMRLAAMKGIPLDPERFTSGTINAFCQNIITENYQKLGYRRPPRCIEPDDARRYAILNRILDSYPKITTWDYGTSTATSTKYATSGAAAIVAFINSIDLIRKNEYTYENAPEELKRIHNPENLKNLFDMVREYERIKKEQCYIEYDDQLNLVFKLGEIDRNLYQNMGYKHILIDEFQDTNLPQIKLLQKMIDTTSFKSFMAVGDDSQSIFAFRDCSPEFMINFGDYFGQNFTDFHLVENHRSGKGIIDFANLVNAKANEKIDKDLIATRPAEHAPTIQGYYTEEQEYKAIAQSIKARWIASEALPEEERKKARDIAVMASDKNELRKIASELTKLGVPSVLMNPIPYMSNSRVAALNSFYNAFTGKGTQGFVDYQNALHHGEYKAASAQMLESIAADFALVVNNGEKSLDAFKTFAKALDENEVDDCYQDFMEKINDCRDWDELTEFFSTFQLYGENSTFKRQGKFEGVCVITVHSAKGLEWNTTYLSLSHMDKADYHKRQYAFENGREHDEVIRKYFVGATRARDELIITGRYCVDQVGRKKDVRYYNQYLQMGYSFLNKPWDYSVSAMYRQKALEEEEKEALKSKIEYKPQAIAFEADELGEKKKPKASVKKDKIKALIEKAEKELAQLEEKEQKLEAKEKKDKDEANELEDITLE